MKLKTLIFTPIAAFALNAFACDQMAIWNFGASASFYTEVPTSHQLQTQPTLSVTGGIKDGNGKDGVAYPSDACGNSHANGQAAAWENLSASAEWIATLDTRGWDAINVRFDYKRWNSSATSLDVSYRINGGAWVQLVNDAALTGSLQVFYPLSFNFSATTALNNQANVEFRFHDLRGTDKLAFDNLEFVGNRVGPEAVLVEDCIADGPYISGVINDPTDPIATFGVNVDVSHPTLPPTSLTLTGSSGNTSVVPSDTAHIIISGTGTHRTVRIIPTGRGYTTITLTVSDGTVSSILNLFYAGTPTGTTPAAYIYGAGISDASTAVALDNNYMLVANDEIRIENSGPQEFPGPQLFLFNRNASGRACQNWDLTSFLALPDQDKEIDIEGSTRIGGRIYWIGALGNNKDGECRQNRNRLFATDISGRAPNITLAFGGYYQFMREDLIAWDHNNWHVKGADHYGFQNSAYCAESGGIIPKRIDGFNVEGFAMAPDGTTAYVAFRAPLVPVSNRTNALIVPIKNFPTWFAQQDGSGHVNRRLNISDFAAPIELNLNGRSIRSIEPNSMGEYLIVAGSYADVEDTFIGYQLYRWSGNATDRHPQLLGDLTSPVPQIVGAKPGAYEGIAHVPLPVNGSPLQLVLDNGRSLWYNNFDPEAKELPGGHQRFAVECVNPPNPGTSIASGLGGGPSTCAIAEDGTVYVVQDSGQSAYLVALNGNGLTTKWTYTLNSTSPYNAWSHSPVIGSDGAIYAGTKDYVHAVNPNGTTRWTFNIGGRRLRSNLAIGVDGTIYVCANTTSPSLVRAYAIWPNGTQRWAYDMGSGTAETIALGDGVLYAANEDGGGIYAIDAATGTLIWQVHPPSSSEPSTVTVAADGTIYVTGDDNNLTALNPNGTTKWVYNTPNSVDGDIALGNDGMIFAAINGGGIKAVRPDGTLAWSASVLTSCNSGVTLGPDGTLYAATCAGELVGLNALDGSTKWSTTTGAVKYRSRPALSPNGMLFIHNESGTVSHYANAGWSPDAYQTAMAGYARSSWPTRRQNPFGTGRQVVIPAPTSEAVWKEEKAFSVVPTINQSIDEAQGYHFTPYSNGEIYSLGGYFSGTKTIKLFNRSTGAVLANARVTDNYNWSYTPITPVSVVAGVSYTVAVYLEGSGGSLINASTNSTFPRNSKFTRIDGSTYISTAGSPDARPVNVVTNGQMKGQADVKFRTSGQSIWQPFLTTWDTTNYLGGGSNLWQYAMGYHFYPSTDGWVTALGGMFNGYAPVKLFEKTSGKLLAVTFVSSYSNSFSFTPIQPVALKAGTYYTVAAYLGTSSGTRGHLGPTNSLPRFVPSQWGVSNQWIYIQGNTYAWTGPTTNTTVRPTNVETNYMHGQADIKFVPKN